MNHITRQRICNDCHFIEGADECIPVIDTQSDKLKYALAAIQRSIPARESLNIRCPESVTTCDRTIINNFMNEHARVVIKYRTQGSIDICHRTVFADKFTQEQLTFASLQVPLLFQEYIPGQTIYTFVWGACQAHLKVRQEYGLSYETLKERKTITHFPSAMENIITQLCQSLSMDYGVLEWRKNTNDQIYLISLKPIMVAKGQYDISSSPSIS